MTLHKVKKSPILAAPLRFVASYALTPSTIIRTNLFYSETTVHWPHWLTLKAHVHSVTHCQLWKPQHIRTSSVPSATRTLRWIGHSRSFKVILISACRNLRWIVVIFLHALKAKIHYTNFPVANRQDVGAGKSPLCLFCRVASQIPLQRHNILVNLLRTC